VEFLLLLTPVCTVRANKNNTINIYLFIYLSVYLTIIRKSKVRPQEKKTDILACSYVKTHETHNLCQKLNENASVYYDVYTYSCLNENKYMYAL